MKMSNECVRMLIDCSAGDDGQTDVLHDVIRYLQVRNFEKRVTAGAISRTEGIGALAISASVVGVDGVD